MSNLVKITQNAVAQIKKIKKQDSIPQEHKLRVSVIGGGCSGFSYKLDFEKGTKEGDKIIAEGGVELVVDSKSALFLIGTELDFSGGLNGKGFTFTNPNATRTCGCGSSFGV